MNESKEVVEQGVDYQGVNSQVLRRFKGDYPATSSYAMEYRRLATNEVYECTEYVYKDV